jgi:mono/diheme cytochrome c family protein
VTRRVVRLVAARGTAAGIAALLAFGACRGDRGGDEEVRVALARLRATPTEHRGGEEAYRRYCAGCHGPSAAGTTKGPPLAHRYYEPSHHADASFLLAVRNGVAAHHWRFGDMPPQPQVRDDEARAITAYVRWVQREVGIR